MSNKVQFVHLFIPIELHFWIRNLKHKPKP